MSKAIAESAANIEGVGRDARQTAAEAARQHGLLPAERLNHVIDELAARTGVDGASLDAEHRLAAVEDALRRLTGAEALQYGAGLGDFDPARRDDGVRPCATDAALPREDGGRSAGLGDADGRLAAAIEVVEQRSATTRSEAAEVLAAVAKLVSASETKRDAASETFSELSKKLDELEIRLRENNSCGADSLLKSALTELEARLQTFARRRAPVAVETDDHMTAQQVAATLVPAPSRPPLAPANIPLSPGHVAASNDARAPSNSGKVAGADAITIEQADFPALSAALGDGPSTGAIVALETGIRDLTARMETMRNSGSRARRSTDEINQPSMVEKRESEIEWRGAMIAENLEGRNHAAAPRAGAALEAAANEILALLKEPTRAGALQMIEAKLDALTNKAEQAIAQAREPDHYEELSRHVEATHRQLTARFEAGLAATAVETNTLKDLVRTLAEKIESVAGAHATGPAIEALEREIAKIAERIDGVDKGLASLPALEQSIAALFEQIEATRRTAAQAAEVAAQNAQRRRPPETSSEGANRPGSSFEREQRVTHEIAELRALQDEADRRNHLTLSAVQETVGKIADRLAKIETDLGEMRPTHLSPLLAPSLTPIFAPRPERRQDGALNPGAINAAASNAGIVKPKESGAAGAFARDGEWVEKLYPEKGSGGSPRAVEAADFLIEPGSGFPRRREKAEPPLPDLPPVVSREREGGAGRADFIAAARRAAQAAQLGAIAAPPNAENDADTAAKTDLLRQTRAFFRAHRRPIIFSLAALFLAVSVYALSKARVHGMIDEASPTLLKLLNKGLVHGDAAPPPVGSQPRTTGQVTAPAAPTGMARQVRPDPNLRAPNQQDPGLLDPTPLTPPQTLAVPARDTTTPDADTPAMRAIAGSDPIVIGSIAKSDAPRRAAPVAVEPFAAMPIEALRDKAEGGDLAAQFNLGIRFADGGDGPRDLKSAAQWYDKAARQGLATAQYRLAILYEKGGGVNRDLARVQALYLAAAEQGNVRAMHNLAVLAAEGLDGPPDYATAAVWFGKAAEFDVRDSQFNFAVLLARGLGLAQDFARSYTWFAIVAAKGDAEAAAKRDEVAIRLTASDLAAAKMAAETFRPRPPDPATNEAAPAQSGEAAATPTANAKSAKPKVSGL